MGHGEAPTCPLPNDHLRMEGQIDGPSERLSDQIGSIRGPVATAASCWPLLLFSQWKQVIDRIISGARYASRTRFLDFPAVYSPSWSRLLLLFTLFGRRRPGPCATHPITGNAVGRRRDRHKSSRKTQTQQKESRKTLLSATLLARVSFHLPSSSPSARMRRAKRSQQYLHFRSSCFFHLAKRGRQQEIIVCFSYLLLVFCLLFFFFGVV